MLRTLHYLLLLTFFSTFFSTVSLAEEILDISTKNAVIFNTLCAKCHEGECSGRLSFDTGSNAAKSHIKRYTGVSDLSKSETKDFFTLLNYMKTKCSIFMPDNGKWKLENLKNFAIPSAKGYFIPLNILKEGKYRIDIQIKENTHFRIEVLSDHFEHFLDRSTCPDKKNETLQFTIDKAVNTFLRIQSRNTIHIISLKIERDN